MTDKARPRPYIWVSWITKLLAGENKCWWAAWYKAHHKYDRTADDADRADFFKEWTEKHDAITARVAQSFRDAGYVVRVEEEAAFKLQGKAADVAGKPDLVAIKDGEAEVVDAKSGRRRASDHWQVLIYLFALPLSWLQNVHARGIVAYADGEEMVRPLGTRERDAIVGAIRRVSADEEPEPVPSAHECRHCDVAACTARLKTSDGDATRYF